MLYKERKTSELALEYMISSALKTTTGSFSCHSVFFLVDWLWISQTILQQRNKWAEESRERTHAHTDGYKMIEREERRPENLLDEQTPHGLVCVAMPSSSDTVVRSWPWPRHLLFHHFLWEREKRQSQIVFLPLLTLLTQ